MNRRSAPCASTSRSWSRWAAHSKSVSNRQMTPQTGASILDDATRVSYVRSYLIVPHLAVLVQVCTDYLARDTANNAQLALVPCNYLIDRDYT
jgi:hypothetical protein